MIASKHSLSLVAWVRTIALVSLALVIGAFAVITYLSQQSLLREFEQDRDKPVRDRHLIEWKMQVHFERLEQELLRLARLEDLKLAFLSDNREALLEQARPPLNRLRRSSLRVERINFYLPTGAPFLAAHDPAVAAKHLSGNRSIIRAAGNERKLIRGIEPEGETYFLWAATPLYENGRFVGILEMGTPMAFFLQEVKRQLGGEVGLLAKSDGGSAQLVALEATDHELIQALAPSLDNSHSLASPTQQVVRTPKQTYAASLMSLRSFAAGREVVLAILFDITPFSELLGRNTRSLIGVSVGGFFLAALLIYFLTQRLEIARNNLQERTAQLIEAKERERREAEVAQERRRAEEQIQRSLERVQALRDIDAAITSTLDLDHVLDTLLEKIELLLPYSAATLRLFDRETNEVRLFASRNLNGPQIRPRAVRRLHDQSKVGFADLVITSKAAVRVVNAQTDPRARNPHFFRSHGLISYLGLPLIAKEELLGVISFYTKQEHTFSDEEVQFLSTIAGQAAIAIHNSQLHERTKRQALELQQANKAKDEFLSTTSHELRTPINVILGYSHLLKEEQLGSLNGEQKGALERIVRQAKDQLVLVDAMLQTTQIEAGIIKVIIQQVDLHDFFDELKSMYDVPVLSNELILEWDLPSELPTIRTDRTKLKHILQNLIENAIKFTPKGSIRVSAQHVGQHKRTEFKVADTGVGIPKESLGGIFEMFRQVDSSDKRVYGGVGLGLYIVKKLAELLGGNIEVVSEAGEGSTFTVSIPDQDPRQIGLPSVQSNASRAGMDPHASAEAFRND